MVSTTSPRSWPRRHRALPATVSRAGVAQSAEERVVAQILPADLPLATFLENLLVPYEDDEITRLIVDDHDAGTFKRFSHFTVGDFRNGLLNDPSTPDMREPLHAAIKPEAATGSA